MNLAFLLRNLLQRLDVTLLCFLTFSQLSLQNKADSGKNRSAAFKIVEELFPTQSALQQK